MPSNCQMALLGGVEIRDVYLVFEPSDGVAQRLGWLGRRSLNSRVVEFPKINDTGRVDDARVDDVSVSAGSLDCGFSKMF